MSVLSLALARKSVRSFDGKALSAEVLRELLDFARAAENPYGLPLEWVLLDAEADGLSSPVIDGAKTFITAKVPRVPHAEEAFGFSFERTVLRAADMGLGTTWIAGTMDRPVFERAANVAPSQMMPCVSPLGRPAERPTPRDVMMRKGVGADTRLPFEKLFFNGSFDAPLREEDAGALRDALETVRWAPSACNYQPWRVLIKDGAAYFYLLRNKGFGEGRSFDTQKVDLGIALCHFALAMEEAGSALRFTAEDPGLPAPEGFIFVAGYAFA